MLQHEIRESQKNPSLTRKSQLVFKKILQKLQSTNTQKTPGTTQGSESEEESEGERKNGDSGENSVHADESCYCNCLPTFFSFFYPEEVDSRRHLLDKHNSRAAPTT